LLAKWKKPTFPQWVGRRSADWPNLQSQIKSIGDILKQQQQ
jgi:hypothetical protein